MFSIHCLIYLRDYNSFTTRVCKAQEKERVKSKVRSTKYGSSEPSTFNLLFFNFSNIQFYASI